MERVAPRQLNYDDVLPLAIESRSNRRTFNSVNGSTFSNHAGSSIIRIDVNADSMLDASHSYLRVDFKALTQLCPEIGPAWIQRLRIESGGVTIEDINEYGRLYATMLLNQCPEDYVNNVVGGQGLYRRHHTTSYQAGAGEELNAVTPGCSSGGIVAAQGAIPAVNAIAQTVAGADSGDLVITLTDGANTLTGATATVGGTGSAQHSVITIPGSASLAVAAQTAANAGSYFDNEISYMTTPQVLLRGKSAVARSVVAGAANRATAGMATQWGKQSGISTGQSFSQTIPLLSGFLNMDKYLPLIMMNAGFTIELHLAANTAVGVPVSVVSNADDHIPDVSPPETYEIHNCHYVAHLIDLDREFYGKLRSVMEQSAGVLQLSGQTYRHYSGILNSAQGEYTITLPARVKSVKSIFGTFCASVQKGSHTCYNTSVFQNAGITSWRFEIGSVRYPQTDIKFNKDSNTSETQTELHKAFGKLGDYGHSCCIKDKHLRNDCQIRCPTADSAVAASCPLSNALLSGWMLGYDFEAFQKASLESGINTADRSLPINFVCSKSHTQSKPLGNVAAANALGVLADTDMTADFFVLSDAIYYINLDGTVSVSV